MSRTTLIRPRRHRAVRDRPATDTRLLPSPFPPTILHINTHYKRCPKALRLRLRSDQSPSRPLHGRSPDKSRHPLSKGHCQVRAPLTRRIRFASSGDALEHGVMSLPWAIAPCSDSPGLDLAGQSEQSDERRLKTNAPFLDSAVAALAGQSEQSDERRLKTNAPFTDSTVVTTGELPTTNAGHGSPLPSLRMVEHFWWTGLPHTENFSVLVHIPSEVRGKDSTVVTTGELPTTNAGHGSPLPSLGVVEHFWWTGLPHTENFSGLVHIPSEVRGCRRAVADVEHPLERMKLISTGVDAFSRNRPGPSIPSPNSLTIPKPREESKAPAPTTASAVGKDPTAKGVQGSPPTYSVIPVPRHGNPSPGRGIPLTLSNVEGSSGGGGPRLPIRHTHPPTHPRKESPTSPHFHPGKNQFSRQQSKITPGSAHQSKLPLPTSNKGAASPLDPTIF